MDIKTLKHIHFTGIKGVGMTALALCALDLGIKVTGSDVEEEFLTDETLKNRGIKPLVGFTKENLDPKPDLVVTTGAHGGLNNPEVLAAKELGIPVMSHAEALAEFTKGKKVIAVCGVGGKTTTCAMIATILNELGMHPSFAIGVADIPSLGTPGKYDKEGTWFVVEADEYAISPGVDNRPRFSLLEPTILVVTNIEHDHPDIYPTLEDTLRVYREFITKALNNECFVIVNMDNNNISEIVSQIRNSDTKYGPFTFGTDPHAALRSTSFRFNEQATEFWCSHHDNGTRIILRVPGVFNIYNATAAYAAAIQIDDKGFLDGIKDYTREDTFSYEQLSRALEAYTGCKRRFEKIADTNNILIYDDYAHHPSEIAATLKAAREWFPDRRILVYFQPHTYSRTKALFTDFAKSFNDADFVGIADIFASAREAKDDSVSSEMLVEEIKKHHPHPDHIGYAPDWHEGAEQLAKDIKPGDVLLTIGAGDIYKAASIIKEKLENA